MSQQQQQRLMGSVVPEHVQQSKLWERWEHFFFFFSWNSDFSLSGLFQQTRNKTEITT